jgi:hypothetical protein
MVMASDPLLNAAAPAPALIQLWFVRETSGEEMERNVT